MKACPYSEAQLLSIYFEEVSWKSAQDNEDARRSSGSSSSSTYTPNGTDMDTDDQIGADDEIDWFDAERQGLL